MMRLASYLVAFFLAGAGGALAQADKPDPRDAAVVEACLKDAKANSRLPESCIGSVADPCLEKSDDPSTYGMARCCAREHEVWDERLNRAYQKLMAELEPAKRAEVRNMQRAWIVFSDKKCALHRIIEEGSITIPIAAYCVFVETGRQALYLEQFLGEGDNAEGAR